MNRSPASPGNTLAVRLILAALSLGAASLHFGMTPQHADESIVLGVGFVIAAWAQVVVASWLLAQPSRAALIGGTVTQVVMTAIWGVSRTTGLPFGPDRWEAESVGTADVITVVLQVWFVVLAFGAFSERRRIPLKAGLLASALVMGGTTAALASPSVMDHGDHAHDATAEEAAAIADHGDHAAHADDDHATSTLDGAHADDHIVTSDGPPTAEQIARANALLEATRGTIPQWADPEAAKAAGFRPIQQPEDADYIHFVNFAWLFDGEVLNTDQPESLVYRNTDGTEAGYVLESAMYILPSIDWPIPEVGGSLTPWHNHGDLCFRADGMIVGTTHAGECPAGSNNFETPDMLHVWIVDHPDGPFGGIETPE